MTDTMAVNLPGRIGNPNETLGTDPRADQRMVTFLEPLGMAGEPLPVPVTADSSYEDLLAYLNEAEPGFETMFDFMYGELSPVEGVVSHTETIKGVDGNDIPLYIHKPTNASGPLPCIVHYHGGGMVILDAAGPSFARWRDELAVRDLVVVGVGFRNGGGALGPHPFPAGLNDCFSALEWVNANKAELGVSKVVVSGESGGGNLTLATTLKAAKEGKVNLVDGAYAQCPYISNAYGDPPASLPSLTENDGYFLSCEMMAPLARVYDPSGEHDKNPLAWPLHASTEDLTGLPPHVISVNELDPLRDEGLTYYRMLVAAGVAVNARTVNGTCHAGDLLMIGPMPEVFAASARDVASFARSL